MSYRNVYRAYSTSKVTENFHPTHEDKHAFNNIAKETINDGGAVGYVCVKSISDGTNPAMFGEANPKVTCAYAYVDPKLIVRPTKAVGGGEDMTKSPLNAIVGKKTGINYFLISKDINNESWKDGTWDANKERL